MIEKKFLTVGELAKEMGLTVRTLQYYDKEGLLKPSGISEGGRRLYSKKDMVILHQIISLKYLGFSLKEIKSKLFALDKPEEVANVLGQQTEMLDKKIKKLESALAATKALQGEVLKMKEVDFEKYAYIVSMIKYFDADYWMVKAFENDMLVHITDRFKDNPSQGVALYETFKDILERVVELKDQGKEPHSDEAIALAKEWWQLVNDFTEGDMSLLPELMKFKDDRENWDEELAKKQAYIDKFLEEAMGAYFMRENIVIEGMEG